MAGTTKGPLSVAIIGAGVVGHATGSGLASVGHLVTFSRHHVDA